MDLSTLFLEALKDVLLRDLGQVTSLQVAKIFAVEPKLAVTSGLFRFKGKAVACQRLSYSLFHLYAAAKRVE
jgi:hypothetical protein